MEIDLSVPEDFVKLSHEIELVLFRLVQECLTNIHRHSGTKRAAIQIAREGDHVSLQVQDEGKGISKEKLAEIQLQGAGVGISGMRERIRHFGGQMDIQSNGRGTKISFTLPLFESATLRQDSAVQHREAAG
jgi:signal transduction histidine kinase